MLRTIHGEPCSLRLSTFRLVLSGVVLWLAISSGGCGRPFNVKTQPGLPAANYAAKAEAGGVSVQAEAITDENLLYDTFDANLILAGVLPVRVMLTNSSGETLDLSRARFEVRAQGKRFEAVSAKKAFKRLISYYEISAYSKSGYKKSIDDFSEYVLDAKTQLTVGQSRQGLLFFMVPTEAAHGAGLTMVVSRLGAQESRSGGILELRLN